MTATTHTRQSRQRVAETIRAYAVPVVRELPPRTVPVSFGW